MSQLIGQNFKTRIPTFSDDASIEEALKVYHYGVDNYTVEPIPDDSIEGNFRNLDTRVDALESQVGGLGSGIVKFISLSTDPNIITAENATTVPISVRAIASQTTPLQRWENLSGTSVASISTGGYFSTSNYVSIGSLTITSSVAANINIVNASNRGIVVKAAVSQSANMQEWQSFSGSPLAWVNSAGEIYSKSDQVQTLSPFLLIG